MKIISSYVIFFMTSIMSPTTQQTNLEGHSEEIAMKVWRIWGPSTQAKLPVPAGYTNWKELKLARDTTVGPTSCHLVELLPGEWSLHVLDVFPGPARTLLLDGVLEKGLQGQQHPNHILGGQHADVQHWKGNENKKDRRVSTVLLLPSWWTSMIGHDKAH